MDDYTRLMFILDHIRYSDAPNKAELYDALISSEDIYNKAMKNRPSIQWTTDEANYLQLKEEIEELRGEAEALNRSIIRTIHDQENLWKKMRES